MERPGSGENFGDSQKDKPQKKEKTKAQKQRENANKKRGRELAPDERGQLQKMLDGLWTDYGKTHDQVTMQRIRALEFRLRPKNSK